MSIRSFASLVVVASAIGVVTAGCSDPVPPAKQGAVTFNLVKVDQECPAMGAVAFGTVDGKTKAELVDGQGGVSVDCTVSGSGGNFNFSGNIQTSNGNFTIQGTAVPGAATGTASLTLFTSALVSEYIAQGDSMGGAPCTVTLASMDGSSLAAANGRIWAGFTCNVLRNPQSAAGADCAITMPPEGGGYTPPGGYFVFENCGQ